MKKIYTFALAMLSLFAACDEDGDKYTVTGLESSEINTSENSVVLSLDNANINVLTFTWTEGNKLLVNNGAVGSTLGNGTIALQVSKDENFESYTELSSDSYSYAFMGNELNSLAKNLGLAVDVASNLYFRISTSMSTNTPAAYSETAIVKVTPFLIDMSYAKLWDKDKTAIFDSLYSEQLDGIYEGYLALGSWQNFWAKEGDGTMWGNIGEDGKYLTISSDASAWNFWAPGNSGCYYGILNTTKKDISLKYIQTLSLSGDVTADMTFKNSDKKWSCTFTTESDNASFSINGTTLLFDASTGDANENATVGTIALQLLSSADSTYIAGSEASTVTIAKAGEYTLSLSLNGKNLRMSLGSGSVAPDPTPTYTQYVTLYDKNDATTILGKLTSATNTDGEFTGVYTGVCSATGYQNFYFKDDNNINIGCTTWEDVYTVSNESTNNCWFPDGDKSYIVTLDMPNGKWSLVEINSIVIIGSGNDWNISNAIPLTENTTTKTWEASNVTISDGSWGFHFLVNPLNEDNSENWDYILKCPDAGKLAFLSGDNIITGYTSATQCNASVDLCNLTYSISAIE